ncbi:MAG: hypothetical protein M3R15_32830, partial [Acidobacteriota bacterium]|nr:hypothetical protein [Acidobacteriota bacterium]
GITNVALVDPATIIIADRDDLIMIDAATGKRRAKTAHKVERAAFVLVNERGEAVVGGGNEIAGFDVAGGQNTWRARHNPPGRGALRIVAAIAARAASLYFRYGGVASTALRGAQLLNAVGTLRWSGLATRAAFPGLTSLATGYAREYASERFTPFGVLSRALRISAPRVPDVPRPSIDVEERLLDRLDPARQLERVSRFLLRRRRLATLRGQWMYFYTELSQGRGLVGVNVNSGRAERAIRVADPDERFISDEASNSLYVAQDERLLAFPLSDRE